MNIKKPVDYSAMYAELDKLAVADLLQMELCCEIGQLVSDRPEKGAAVAAAEYLSAEHPDVSGFSPRNVRRMREFYRTYESDPEVLAQAMTIGWTQNVVILEAELTLQEKAWYIRAVQRFGWSKLELAKQIASAAHLEKPLDLPERLCCTGENTGSECVNDDENPLYLPQDHMLQPNGRICDKKSGEENRAGSSTSHRVRSHEHQEDWQPAPFPVCRRLTEHGIDYMDKIVRQLRNSNYNKYNLLIGMERANLRNMHRICGGDHTGKMCLLMDYTDHPGDVAEPQHTNDLKTSWCDVLLCYGDSNTYSYDTRSYLGGRSPRSGRWTGLFRSGRMELF